MFGRRTVALAGAEFFGAGLLTLVTLAVSKSNVGFPLFVAGAVGLALSMFVLSVGAVSGGFANPAVTLGLWMLRKISAARAVVYVLAQLLGGLAAGLLFTYMSEQPLSAIAGNLDGRVVLAEVVGTFIFTFGLAAAVYHRYVGAHLAAVAGGSLFLGIVVASVVSNGALNPAVALGIQSGSVTYITGPVIGAALGMGLYALLFAPVESQRRVKKVHKNQKK